MNRNSKPNLLKILIVDDSPLIAERLHSILKEIENLTFLGNALNISAARNLINTAKPDAVIFDIHLSKDEQDQTGIDLLDEIRQNYPQMKVIIFTNHNELHYRMICLEKGADYFLNKSNDSHKISEILKQWTIKK